MHVAAVILAAGASRRFGSPKVLAPLQGRPLLEHVLDAVREAGIDEIVVVLGHAAEAVEEGIDWLDEQLVRNPDPELLSSSLQVGLAAASDIDPPVKGAIVLLGDQPRVRSEVIRGLISVGRSADEPVIVPEYADGGGANPLFLRRDAFDLADEATGDRGLGPLLTSREELVRAVPFGGSNPDVDVPADLVRLEGDGAP